MYGITMCMNGALSGLVGITAGCSVVEPWAALVIGIIGCTCWASLLVKLKIDDAVDAIPVHFGNGIGCIATGLFDNWGMGNDNVNGKLLAVEIFGVLFIIGWVSLIMIPYFFLMNALDIFRVDAIEEEVGLDIAHHKGSAYDLTEYDE